MKKSLKIQIYYEKDFSQILSVKKIKKKMAKRNKKMKR